VAAEHEVEVDAIVLILPTSLPRTTSGKVQRSLCRERFQRGELKAVAQWTAPQWTSWSGARNRTALGAEAEPEGRENGRAGERGAKAELLLAIGREATSTGVPLPLGGPPLSAEEKDRLAERIEARLLDWLVERCSVSPAEADRSRPFADYGLDSLAAVELSQELEKWLHVRLSAVAAWNYPTPASLARYLAELAGGGPAEPASAVDVPATDSTDFERLLAEIEALSEHEVAAALAAGEPAVPGEAEGGSFLDATAAQPRGTEESRR
jgi:acyl carrier protein